MGWKYLVALVAAVLIVPAVAVAAGAARQEVRETIEINLPPAKVWARIGDFQDMSWHPAVAKTQGKGGNAAGATRVLTLKGGGTIDEALEAYSAADMSYSYRITTVDVKVLPVTGYSSRLSVQPLGDGRALIEWRGSFYRGAPGNNPPPDLSDEAAVKAVTGVYRAGLDHLKKLLEEEKG